ncbi:hypothetical protein [Microbacterium lacticum]|uniref:hypothetical protein n=1 Tax=Microbacterium lacticum TaxID=33885 RepID=UPI0028D76897|nr:hypothetical protein [Microbacterium lacticum]
MPARRLITALSRVGIMDTVESAGLPALLAATNPDDHGGTFDGPTGPRGLGGRPGEVPLYSRLRSREDATRIWDITEALTGVSFPAA